MPGGRPKAEYSQALRLLKIWEMLHHRAQVTISELMARFGIDRRTVQRDLAVLSETYSIEEGERTDSNEKTFRLRPTARIEPLRLTVLEMIALYMGKNLFAFTKGTHLADAMESLYEKLQERLSEHNAEVSEKLPKKLHCTTGFPKRYRGSDDVLNETLSALLNEEKLAVTYRPPGKRPYDDVVLPYTLVAHNHGLYLLALSERAREQRSFALERVVKAARERGVTFPYPKRYDPARALASAFGITTGFAPTQVSLLFDADLAPYIQGRQWHPTMKAKTRRDGRLELRISVSVGEELVHWLTGYGPKVRVIAPRQLRERVRQLHQDALT